MKAVVSAVLLAGVFALGCGDDSNADPDIDAPPTDSDGADPDAGVTGGITCEDPVPAAADGICDITAGTGEATLIRGDVLTADGVIENGAVLIAGDTIACVGCDCGNDPAAATATRINCAGAAISPGLINPHDHATYSEGFPIDTGTERYDHRHDWRGSLDDPQNAHGTGGDSAGMRWVELRMLFGGVTSAASAGSADGLIRNLDGLETAEKDRGFEYVDSDTFPLDDAREGYFPNCTWNYSYSTKDVIEVPAYLPHIAEGINDLAAEEFACLSTEAGNAEDYTQPNIAHIHGIGLTAADYLDMATDQTKLIWSARSNISLYGVTADVVTFDRLGGQIALGTDWIYSGSANSLRELACAKSLNDTYYDGYFSDQKLWEMVTINAAAATGSEQLIGSLEEGKLADVAVFAGPGGYSAVVGATNEDVALVLKSGQALYGEAEILAGLGESCDPVDVCGNERAVCASREFGGATFADIKAEVATGDAAYPAVLCGEPAMEPTCIPSRPGEFTGEITDTDLDGDGLTDTDNCPAVFNPIRPMDAGVQPDADGDGQGDPCDPTPIGDDLDGDTIANDADNCVADANTDQADADGDGIGDVCDACPDAANPDSICPPAAVTIQQIQQGEIGEGTAVTLSGVVVTGFSGVHATVQDPAGGEYSGILLFVGSDPGVAVGDIVDVEGQVTEYFGVTEIEDAVITVTGNQSPLSPTVVTVAQAASEEYEGVLVQVTGTVTSAAYDCSADDPDANQPCEDENLWEIGGASGVLVYDRLYQGTDWTMHIGAMDAEVTVIGVMGFRYLRRRIMPRVAADFCQSCAAASHPQLR